MKYAFIDRHRSIWPVSILCEQLEVSPLSLMPEGWEKQLTPQELVDLLHFLTLDGPPHDPQAKRLPGTPELKTLFDKPR